MTPSPLPDDYLRPVFAGAQHRPRLTGSLLLMGVLLVVLALFSQALSLNFVLLGLGGLGLLLFVWISISLRGLRVRRRFTPRAFMGQSVPVTVEIENRSLLPLLWLELHEALPLNLRAPNFYQAVVSFAPFERLKLNYMLTCRQRGYYTIGGLSLSTGDFWGVFEQEGAVAGQQMIVYPRVVPLTQIRLPARAPVGTLAQPRRLLEDPSRFFGVRDYIPGDTLRQMHWKATASTGRLQVRRFESSISLNTQIVLDLTTSRYPVSELFTATEMGVTVAASLAVALNRARQTLGLSVLGFDPLNNQSGLQHLPLRSGQAHLMQLLALLARIERSESDLTLAQLVQQASLHLPWGTLLVVVAPASTPELEGLLSGLQRRGIQPVVLLTAAGAGFLPTQARLKVLGVPCWRAERDSDLDRWR